MSNNLYPYLQEHFAPALRAAARLNETEEAPKHVSTRGSTAAHDRRVSAWLSRAKWNSSKTSKNAPGCWGL